MVATISRRQERRDPGPGRSLRFGLLVAVLLLGNLSWYQQNQVTVGFVGDILPDRGVKSVIRKIGLSGLFKYTPALFQGIDLVCANLEAAITIDKTPLIKTFRFNGPHNLGEYLANHKIKIVSLANNHTIDYGRSGLQDTVANLNRYQVAAFGYGADARQALEPKILELQGVKIAFIGAVCFPLEGYVYLPDAFDVGRWDAQLVGRQIKEAKKKADLVVVCLHWGIEFSHYPASSQIQMGHYCIDQGADLVIGHHPHVIQGMEIYQNKPICYSLGNFIFDQRFGPTTESILVKAAITGKKIRQLEVIPVSIEESVPKPADPDKAAEIIGNFLKYSEPFELKKPHSNRWDF